MRGRGRRQGGGHPHDPRAGGDAPRRDQGGAGSRGSRRSEADPRDCRPPGHLDALLHLAACVYTHGQLVQK